MCPSHSDRKLRSVGRGEPTRRIFPRASRAARAPAARVRGEVGARPRERGRRNPSRMRSPASRKLAPLRECVAASRSRLAKGARVSVAEAFGPGQPPCWEVGSYLPLEPPPAGSALSRFRTASRWYPSSLGQWSAALTELPGKAVDEGLPLAAASSHPLTCRTRAYTSPIPSRPSHTHLRERISFGGGPPSGTGPDRRRRGPPRKLCHKTTKYPGPRRHKRVFVSRSRSNLSEISRKVEHAEPGTLSSARRQLGGESSASSVLPTPRARRTGTVGRAQVVSKTRSSELLEPSRPPADTRGCAPLSG